jgi:hypothetical protein
MKPTFAFPNLGELCRRTHEEMRRGAAKAINAYLVVRNWFFGWYIVEYEQNGADRSEYGAATLQNLSAALSQASSEELLRRVKLNWSHYVTLMTIDNLDERRFYEIEAAANGWSVSELDRQLASSLYERLAL